MQPLKSDFSSSNPPPPSTAAGAPLFYGDDMTNTATQPQRPLYECAGSSSLDGFTWCEWFDESCRFSSQVFGNITNLVESIVPKVAATHLEVPQLSTSTPSTSSTATHVNFAEPSFYLREMWATMDLPYGVRVPLQNAFLCPFRPPEHCVFYTPILSGINFTFMNNSKYLARLSATSGISLMDDNDDTMSTSSFGSAKGFASGGNRHTMVWYAAEKPENRAPLVDQVDLLQKQIFPALYEAENTDFTHNSWFAVLWQPIQCNNHTPQRSCGSFLAMYLIRPPRYLFFNEVLEKDRPRRKTTSHFFACDNASTDSAVFRCDQLSISYDLWQDKKRCSRRRAK